MARLFADENYPRSVVLLLRKYGHDVVAVQDRGFAGIADDKVLALAIAESRAVITENRKHFLRLHRAFANHCGIIATTADYDRAAIALRVHEALIANLDLTGKLIRIYRPNKPESGHGRGKKKKRK